MYIMYHRQPNKEKMEVTFDLFQECKKRLGEFQCEAYTVRPNMYMYPHTQYQ